MKLQSPLDEYMAKDVQAEVVKKIFIISEIYSRELHSSLLPKI